MSTTRDLSPRHDISPVPDPAWVAPTKEAMRRLSLLRDNWDTYGDPRIDPAILHAASSMLQDLMRSETPAPSVVPTSRGGVQLEWHVKGIDLEVEFFTPVSLHTLFEDHRTDIQWEAELIYDFSRLSEAIVLLSRL